jgi:hypothetical protein
MIELEELRMAVHDVVEEAGPDVVYQPEDGVCRYVDGDQPSCLIGQALYRLGISLSQLTEWDGDSVDDACAARDIPVFEKNSDVAHYADVVQNMQDNGNPWGIALAQAEYALQNDFEEV